MRIKRKVDAAVKIQRAWKRFRRFQIVGVSTAELPNVQ
jgi:hypothetical protein